MTELVGLGKAARRKAGGYSLGMRQRLGIAAAMLGDPPILIMDEPFNGMDPEGIIWMRGFLRGLAAEGRAVLVSSHLLSELPDVADHVVVIGRGRVLADGTIQELTAGAASLEDAYLRLTTGAVEYRSGADRGAAPMSSLVQPSRGGGFRAALRAEWTKFRTVRGWMIGAGVRRADGRAVHVPAGARQAHRLLHDPQPEQLRQRPSIRSDRAVRRSGRRHLRARRQAAHRRRHDHRPDHVTRRPDLGRAGQRGAVTARTPQPG